MNNYNYRFGEGNQNAMTKETHSQIIVAKDEADAIEQAKVLNRSLSALGNSYRAELCAESGRFERNWVVAQIATG